MQKEIVKKSLLSKLLTHKKIILAAILPLGFWAGIFGFWVYSSNNQQSNTDGIIINKTKQYQSNQKSIDQIAFASSAIDSDNDGLPDWEESIYGTDIHNPDSDGDGYLDGEEVISGHDPLKKGPNDLLNLQKSDKNSEKTTATENLSKIVIENYLKTIQNQGYQDISPEQLSRIITDSFNSDQNSTENFNDILKSELLSFIPQDLDKEIKISKDNSDKNIKKYWNNIANLFSETLKNAPPYDLLKTINESMKNKDYRKMDEISNYYKNSYENVKMITVPSSLESSHKNIATTFYKYWKISEAIKSYDQDPMMTLLALNELTNLLQKTIK